MNFIDCVTLIADFSTILIAILALFISIKTLKSQNKHNELSARPICEMFTGNFNNELVVEIHNKGLGPMEIIEALFTSSDGFMHTNLYEFVSNEPGISYNALPPKKILMSGEKVILVSFNDIPSFQQTQIVQILSNITIHISYRDLYDNTYTFDHQIHFL